MRFGPGMVERRVRRRAFCLGAAAMAATWPTAAPAAAAPVGSFPRLSHGVNLHQLLNWPEITEGGRDRAYVWPPFAQPSYSIRDSELAQLRAIGFDFLRVTADPGILISSTGDRGAFLLEHIRRVVTRLLGAGFKVVLDLHPVAANPPYAPVRVVERSPTFEAYCDMTGRVAGALADLPLDRFALELMNEPWLSSAAQQARWPKMLVALHDHARRAAPDLPLVLTGADWSSARALASLDPAPFRDSNVLYTFHYYDPHSFTHQGVEGDENAPVAGLGWPVSAAGAAEALQAALRRAEDAPGFGLQKRQELARAFQKLAREPHGAGRIEADFDSVANWAQANAIPIERIFLGEFGCVSKAHEVATPNRLEWLSAVRKAAEARRIPWALWAYKGYGGMGLVGDHGVDWPVIAALGLRHAE